MKNKIYSISLLLSFFGVLSHSMIFHHHDELENYFSINFQQNDENNHHHNENQLHFHDRPDEKNDKKGSEHGHNFPFPFHHHISATNDFDFSRVNSLEWKLQIRNLTSILLSDLFFGTIPKPPGFTLNLYGDKSFLIHTLFKPSANVLRGPPSIA